MSKRTGEWRLRTSGPLDGVLDTPFVWVYIDWTCLKQYFLLRANGWNSHLGLKGHEYHSPWQKNEHRDVFAAMG